MQSTFSRRTAISIVIANMIGTGVFTSLGYQLLEFQSTFAILLLWVLGGVIALCGALCYAELGAALPRSGGEYNFLSELYHPAAGFVSGWVSATIGFGAPTALAAITFGKYLAAVWPAVSPVWAAAVLVVVAGALHATNRRTSGGFQFAATIVKIVLILAFCLGALALVPQPQSLTYAPAAADVGHILSAGFAISLIYVNYAYTGWNVATYMTGELDNAQQHLPSILLVGTGTVMVLYVLLNGIFLYVAPAEALAGKVEVGHVAATYAFGEVGGDIMGLVLALLLISTVSAMILAGPRVLQTIGEDFPTLSVLGRANADGVPVLAIAVQCGISLLLIFTAAFDAILLFTGFTLAFNTLAAVLGVFVLRRRGTERPFSMPLYPLPPIVFAVLTLATMVFLITQRPVEALWGAAIVVSGLVFYALSRRAH